jgi:hypothetical protein
MRVIAIDTLRRKIEKRFCDGCRSKDREEFKAGYCCEMIEDTMNFIDTLPTIEMETVKLNDEIEQAFRQGYTQAKKEGLDPKRLTLEIAKVAKRCARSDAQKALVGRILFIIENMSKGGDSE